MNQESQNNKLNAKDLINVGIFTAVYFALYFLIMMLGYIPVFTILLGIQWHLYMRYRLLTDMWYYYLYEMSKR